MCIKRLFLFLKKKIFIYYFFFFWIADPIGMQGRRINTSENTDCLQVWVGPLSGIRFSVVLWNRYTEPETIEVSWEDLGLDSKISFSIRDLWKVRAFTSFYTLHNINILLHLFGIFLVKKNIYNILSYRHRWIGHRTVSVQTQYNLLCSDCWLTVCIWFAAWRCSSGCGWIIWCAGGCS